MPEKPSIIRCPKCGDEPNLISDTCLKCGAALEKKCGGCGFSNSVEKNYCDQCGSPLFKQAPPAPSAENRPAAPHREAPKLELQGIQDSVTERDFSFRQKLTPDQPLPPPPPAAGPAPKPAPAPAQRKPEPPAGPHLSDHGSKAGEKPAPQAPAPAPAPAQGLKKYTLTAAGLGGLLALVAIVYALVIPFLPRWQLTRAAKAYLTSLSQGKYEQAYEQLSTNSKAACTPEEYAAYNAEYYEKRPAWEFRDPQIFTITKNAAVIKYQLREAGGEWKPDYISFVQEHGRWTRPYIWILFQPIDEAMERRDFAQALFLAQKLYLTDPMDPRASGYLCATEFFMGLYGNAAESCKRTVDAAASFPVGYTSTEIYWFNLYYADSLRYMERYRAALDEYEKMLKLPNLTVDEQCPLFLNRADVYVNMKDYERGLADIMRAETACTQSPSKEDAAQRRFYMGGGAGEDAITFAKRSRITPDGLPMAAERRKQLEDLAAKLGPKGAKYLPRDTWSAVHLVGPEYRVTLRQETLDRGTQKKETSDIFIFAVNLWTKQGKVERSPAQAAR